MMRLMARMGGVRTTMMRRATIARRGGLSVSMRWFADHRTAEKAEDEALRVEKEEKSQKGGRDC